MPSVLIEFDQSIITAMRVPPSAVAYIMRINATSTVKFAFVLSGLKFEEMEVCIALLLTGS